LGDLPGGETVREGSPVRHHRWVVVVTYRLSQDEAKEAMTPGAGQIPLDHENRIAISGPGCLDCEYVWGEVHDQPCRAPRAAGIQFGRSVPPAVATDLAGPAGRVRSDDQ
jgi:hypothetical protein